MSFEELRKSVRYFEGALMLEDFISERTGEFISRALLGLILLFAFLGQTNTPYEKFFSGGFLMLSAVAIFLFLIRAFHTSYYFRGLHRVVYGGKNSEDSITFELAEIIFGTDEDDLTAGFFRSHYSRVILERLGVPADKAENFLRSRKNKVTGKDLNITCLDHEHGFSLFDYAVALFESDGEFREFLFSQSIQKSEFCGAVAWVERVVRKSNDTARWWSRQNLGRIQGVAKDWAYGNIFTLEKFSAEIPAADRNLGASTRLLLEREIDRIESALAKNTEANVFLVGDDHVSRKAVLSILAEKISEGSVLPQIEHKRVMLLNATLLIDAAREKTAFENLFVKILNESVEAGNIILVFEDFPAFIESARSIGSDALATLIPYLESSGIQFIATLDENSFHQKFEINSAVMQYFEKVQIRDLSEDDVVAAIQSQALYLEWQYGIFFTYGAMIAIAEGAARYFGTVPVLDKALDILNGLPPAAEKLKKKIIQKSDVLAYLEADTGIPLSEATSDEKKTLMNLEEILHRRIVGQNAAIEAISNAMRRTRAGIGNKNRPIGSFLFLGPTGVGKTETTKALSQAFFGSESKILRLDMSEYKGSDALPRLIGSFESGKTGSLSTLLRENPYGVLLLDEFEKTSTDVHDLFLQILDEGFFTDMAGKKVNARNVIIIATSNAGSDLIFDMVGAGKRPSEHREALIDVIVDRAIFKPELLNRFDGVIFFEPLGKAELRKIAELMLANLQNRLREKGVELVINDVLLDKLVEAGTDPKFGARPLNRVIQDKIEQVIAKKLLSEAIHAGEKVELASADLA